MPAKNTNKYSLRSRIRAAIRAFQAKTPPGRDVELAVAYVSIVNVQETSTATVRERAELLAKTLA